MSVASSSNAWIASMVRMFASQGVAPPALFADAALDIERLKRAHERFTGPEVNRLWLAAVRLSGQATLGLDRQLARRYVRFDIATQSMWSGPTLVDALEGLAKYLALINDSAAFTIHPGRANCWLQLSNGSDRRTPRQRIEFGMLALLMLCQKVSRHAIRPVGVDFVFAEPADFHPYRMAFQCPLRFGQPRSRICISSADMALPVEQRAESLFALHDKLLEQRLERLAGARTSYRASEEIIRRLHLGEPSRAAVARSVGLAEVEFEKRLRAEGQSFAELLDDVRKELASHYLSHSAVPLTQVVGLLGWHVPAEFSVAAKRWFGMAPAQYRQRHASAVS